MFGELEDEVGGCAEACEGEALAVFEVCELERAIADGACAEEWRGVEVGEGVG